MRDFMNALDFAILAIIALSAYFGYKKGLIRTVYRLVSFFIAIFIARRLYPYVARALHQTTLFAIIEERIAVALNLEGMRGLYIIDDLPIPRFMQTMLHNNNTPDMFELLQVDTIENYVSSFFANMVLNGIAALAVFALTLIVLAVIGYALDLVSRLPVINFVNRFCGLLFGFIISVAVIWLCLIVLVLAGGADLHGLLDSSWLASRLLEATLPQFVLGGAA